MSNFSSDLPVLVNGPRMPIIHGQVLAEEPGVEGVRLTIRMVRPLLLEWTRFEMRRSPWTVKRYEEALGWVIRYIGDIPVDSIHSGHILEMRRRMDERGLSEARMASILNSLRSLLKFSRQVLRLEALDPRYVRIPRVPRRDVLFLTKEEVTDFLERALSSSADWRTAPIAKLRLRALAEVLLGTGARIAEVLRLKRADVRFDLKEAKTIGKGNKERILFFTDRSLEWLGRYLERRTDDLDSLFVTSYYPSAPLSYSSLKQIFQRRKGMKGLSKKVTPHILRHTMATALLFNGCPIGHIKELLGHERLDTTCRYYLGLDKRAAKEAHQKFLRYE